MFYGSEVGNLLPGTSYASYDLVEAARSMLAAALQGESLQPSLCIAQCDMRTYKLLQPPRLAVQDHIQRLPLPVAQCCL